MKEKQIQGDILKAAIRVFTAKGKNGARMQEIADEAGVNKMLLHYYFKSKDVLFTEVLKSVLTELYYSVVDISYKAATVKDVLATFIDRHFEFLQGRRDILMFLFWEVNHGGRDMIQTVLETFKNLGGTPLDAMAARIREAMAAGEIKMVDPYALIFNLFSLNIFFYISLPLITLHIRLDEKELHSLTEKRKKEIFRLLWNDIKNN